MMAETSPGKRRKQMNSGIASHELQLRRRESRQGRTRRTSWEGSRDIPKDLLLRRAEERLERPSFPSERDMTKLRRTVPRTRSQQSAGGHRRQSSRTHLDINLRSRQVNLARHGRFLASVVRRRLARMFDSSWMPELQKELKQQKERQIDDQFARSVTTQDRGGDERWQWHARYEVQARDNVESVRS
jgi:hypothetical protein